MEHTKGAKCLRLLFSRPHFTKISMRTHTVIPETQRASIGIANSSLSTALSTTNVCRIELSAIKRLLTTIYLPGQILCRKFSIHKCALLASDSPTPEPKDYPARIPKVRLQETFRSKGIGIGTVYLLVAYHRPDFKLSGRKKTDE